MARVLGKPPAVWVKALDAASEEIEFLGLELPYEFESRGTLC